MESCSSYPCVQLLECPLQPLKTVAKIPTQKTNHFQLPAGSFQHNDLLLLSFQPPLFQIFPVITFCPSPHHSPGPCYHKPNLYRLPSYRLIEVIDDIHLTTKLQHLLSAVDRVESSRVGNFGPELGCFIFFGFLIEFFFGMWKKGGIFCSYETDACRFWRVSTVALQYMNWYDIRTHPLYGFFMSWCWTSKSHVVFLVTGNASASEACTHSPTFGSLNGEGRILLLHGETNHRRPLNVLFKWFNWRLFQRPQGFFLGWNGTF